MLVDMHEKLSQAVKLYDKLLTEQLSRPQWRPAGPSAVPVQQSPSGYSQYQPVNGTYSQWQPTPSTPAPAQSYLPPTPSAPVSQPAGAYATSPITEHPPQQMYQPVTPSTAPTFTPNSPVTQPRYGQEGRPYAAVSPPPPVSIPQYGVPPTPVTYQAILQPPVAVATPAPPPPAPTFSQPQVVPQAPFAQQQQPQQRTDNTTIATDFPSMTSLDPGAHGMHYGTGAGQGFVGAPGMKSFHLRALQHQQPLLDLDMNDFEWTPMDWNPMYAVGW